MFTYILYKLCYIKYNDISIYVYLNCNNIVLNSINIRNLYYIEFLFGK